MRPSPRRTHLQQAKSRRNISLQSFQYSDFDIVFHVNIGQLFAVIDLWGNDGIEVGLGYHAKVVKHLLVAKT